MVKCDDRDCKYNADDECMLIDVYINNGLCQCFEQKKMLCPICNEELKEKYYFQHGYPIASFICINGCDVE